MEFFCLTLVAFHWFIIHDGSLSQFFSFFLYFFVPGNWYQNCSLKMLHIVVVWMDGGAFWKLLWRLSIYLWSDYSEVRRKKTKKHPKQTWRMSTAARGGDHLFPQEPNSNNKYYVRQRCAEFTVSEEFNKIYVGPLCSQKSTTVILWYNIARSTFLPALTVLVRYSKFRIVHIQIDWRVYVVLFNNENSLWIAD